MRVGIRCKYPVLIDGALEARVRVRALPPWIRDSERRGTVGVLDPVHRWVLSFPAQDGVVQRLRVTNPDELCAAAAGCGAQVSDSLRGRRDSKRDRSRLRHAGEIGGD